MLQSVLDAVAINELWIGAHLALPMSAVVGLPVPGEPLAMDALADRNDYMFSEAATAVWRPGLGKLIVDRCAYEIARQQPGSLRWGRPSAHVRVLVKEPNGSIAAPVIMASLPRSRLLFLVRDGRDVVDSYMDGASDGWITKAYGSAIEGAERLDVMCRAARRWVQSVEAVQQAFERHPNALRIRVKYEDLVTDPVRQVRRIVRWMGRGDALAKVEHVVNMTAFSEVPTDVKGQGQFFRAASPGLWRASFDEHERAALDEIMSPTLERFGYDV